jgi:hypothetical protein
VNKQMLLFGGMSISNEPFADTWQWDGQDWTQLSDEGPAARAGHAMASDSETQSIVLFGGTSVSNEPLADTWQWDGTEWTETADTGPSPRSRHSLACDAIRNRIVLFGGTPTGVQVLNDTWEWNGLAWTQAADFGPAGRLGSSLVFAGGRVLLFGGRQSPDDVAAVALGDTWEWSGKRWTQRQDIGPSRRWAHTAAYDANRRRVVLFGGFIRSVNRPAPAWDSLSDTWEHPDNEAALASGPPTVISISIAGYVSATRTGTGEVTLSHTIAGTSPRAVLSSSHPVVFAPSEISFGASRTGAFIFYVDLDIPVGAEMSLTATVDGISRTTRLVV